MLANKVPFIRLGVSGQNNKVQVAGVLEPAKKLKRSGPLDSLVISGNTDVAAIATR